MAKRPYLDDLQTARLWAKVKALVSPLSSRVTTLEGQVQTNTNNAVYLNTNGNVNNNNCTNTNGSRPALMVRPD